VSLAEHNNVVKAFPSDRTDQPFGICVLPQGTRRCWSVANAYRSKPSDEDFAIGHIPIADRIAGSLFPTACFRELIGDPFCCWMRCDAKPQDMSPAVPHDQQSIEQAERDCRHDEQIHRRDAVRVIAEERLPSLRGRAPPPRHILGYARLTDIDTELAKLAMDPRRSPQWVCDAHLSDQPAYFRRHRRSTATRSQLPAPVRSESGAVPTEMVCGFTIANASRALGNHRYRQTNTNRSMALNQSFLGAVRLRTFICCRNVQISASSAARDRNRSTTIQPISLQRSLMAQQHRPILHQLPAR